MSLFPAIHPPLGEDPDCWSERHAWTDGVRIVGGRLAGRHLISPGGRVRPTAETVRARWLSELEPELKGARVLELFAGTGALGLEALSRGATSVDFLEWNPAALHALKGNVTALRARKQSRIFVRDAMGFVSGLECGAYDMVLADPPYTSSLAERLVRIWMGRPFARVLSVEHAVGAALPRGGSSWRLEESEVTTYRVSPSRTVPSAREAPFRQPSPR